MSLHEVWQAAASSPFVPAVSKDSQLFIGLLSVFIGLVFTVLFGLNRSITSIPAFGIPASIAFAFGAIYTICAKSFDPSNTMDKTPIFTALTTSTRRLYLLLRSIAFTTRAEVYITPEGLRFTVEESHAVQGSTLLDKNLFSSYSLSLSGELTAIPAFQVNVSALLETLQIFGLSEATSASSYRHQNGGLSSAHTAAFTTPALNLGGTCRISYDELGAPLSIAIDEGSVKTTCEMTTYELSSMYDEDIEIPLDRGNLTVKVIMRSTWLSDAINELSNTDPEVLVISASSTSEPHFSLEGQGGPFGDSRVDFNPEVKGTNSSSAVRTRKQPQATEIFTVRPPAGSNGRVRQSYKFDLIKKAGRAMQLASKVSIRQDKQGVLSLQFMIDALESGVSANDSYKGGALSAVDKVSFIDFRFVPLFEGGEEEGEGEGSSEDNEDDSNKGEDDDEGMETEEE